MLQLPRCPSSAPILSRLPAGGVILLDHWRQRPKRLFVRAEHVPGDIAEQGGLKEVFSELVSLPAGHNGGPFGNRVTHVFLYLCEKKKRSPGELA